MEPQRAVFCEGAEPICGSQLYIPKWKNKKKEDGGINGKAIWWWGVLALPFSKWGLQKRGKKIYEKKNKPQQLKWSKK